MNRFFYFIILSASVNMLLCACSQQTLFDRTAGDLRLAIDGTGKITVLEDISTGANYIDSGELSYLLECAVYEKDSVSALMQPRTAKVTARDENGTGLELTFGEDLRITVNISSKEGYFRMELVDATPVSEISHIVWGPYKTTMRGHIGEWLGVNRSGHFTVGLMSLEPNTDGGAAYSGKGSRMQLSSYDHTRGYFGDRTQPLRKSVPLPGVTVVGSAAALFGSPAGKEKELETVEKIVLAEGLPHPTFNGVWNKYSDEGKKFCIWGYYDEANFDEYLELSKKLQARILCRPHGFSKNWGHFDIDPKIYPGGIPAILKNSRQARKDSIGLTLYTLTTFLKPLTEPEPYLTPVPDDRLQTWRPEARLMKAVSPDDTTLTLQNTEEVAKIFRQASKVIRIDNEFIEFKEMDIDGEVILAKKCQRGAFLSRPESHREQSSVKLMYVSGFHNFYPGTLEMSNEFVERLNDLLVSAELDNFVVDGYESCIETGYGTYTGNIFLKKFHERCVEQNREILITGSMFTQYSWHFMSHESWGEHDQERGVRGTMLDYRLSRQMELRRNLMPNKLGQYYPSMATAEDINWLMALATGWDAGVDFQLDIETLKRNPELEKISETLHLWNQARAENAFSEQQKMALRQTDVLYKLSRKEDGKWDLSFDRFWQDEKVKILPPSAMAATPVNGDANSVRPLSIDWSWTHNPGLYEEAGLSDDLVQQTGKQETRWQVTIPSFEDRESWTVTSRRHFQCVIRLPENAPCAVQNFRVSVNGETLEIPAVLQPGEYISIPHLLEIACVYDKTHHVTGEIDLYGYLPKVKKGETVTVGLSCEPLEKDANPEVIMNVRCQNGFFYHR
ncbi:MAG: hypothetical protein LBL07_14680 [Tannerella sp.]|jgi:hypothetical protein|nr:hypothetical protein [Tannerella sp.]